MSNTLVIFCYCVVAYGLSNMMVFGSGPFRIFEHIRNISSAIGEHFGQLFSCMMCFPANFGWVMSVIDWFLLPNIAITPFNIILTGTGYWWLALLLDCCFTSGMVWFVHHIEEWFENEAERAVPSEIVEEADPDAIVVDDITKKVVDEITKTKKKPMNASEVAKSLAYKPFIDTIVKDITDTTTEKNQ